MIVSLFGCRNFELVIKFRPQPETLVSSWLVVDEEGKGAESVAPLVKRTELGTELSLMQMPKPSDKTGGVDN